MSRPPSCGCAPATPPDWDAWASSRPGAGATETFTDDPGKDEFDWAARPDQPSSARLLFTTGPLAEDLRVAGTGQVTVTVRSSTPTAHVSAALVDYGPATVRDSLGAGEGIRTLDTQSCWGESRDGDDACFRDTATTTRNVDLEVFARGWADIGNHASLTSGERLVPGRPYTMTFRLSTTDHVVPAGHRLGLLVGGTDRRFVVAPARPPTVTLDLARSSVALPLLGGSGAVPPWASVGPVTIDPTRVPPKPDVRLNHDTD
nr:hypothetical protein GCM10020241_44380 [Streptoalloteichus tenebrarius]